METNLNTELCDTTLQSSYRVCEETFQRPGLFELATEKAEPWSGTYFKS